eukprot:scaffold11883_cov137-Isochrysis_galbana.AAC.1
MDEHKFERWRLLVGLTNIPRGPRERLIRLAIDLSLILTTKWVVASESAREGADVGFVVGGSALFGFELATGFFPRLEDVPKQCSVEPALSSTECLGRGLIRSSESSAYVCVGGQLPVWHCFPGYRAFRLVLWLCCDSVTPQKEEPRCLQTYDTDPHFVVLNWLSSIAGSNCVALWLTLLSCAGSRGRFGDEAIPMSTSFGTEAEGRRSGARVSGRLLHAKPKIGFRIIQSKACRRQSRLSMYQISATFSLIKCQYP